MRKLLPFLLLLLTACAPAVVEAPTPTPQDETVFEDELSAPMQETVLVDDSSAPFTVQGIVTDAVLHIELTRGSKPTGWSGVGMTIGDAPRAFVGAQWRGDCERHLDPKVSFGVRNESYDTIDIDADSIPVTKGDDGCDRGSDTINLTDLIAAGATLSFSASDPSYHVKVTLQHRGEITVR